MERHGFIGEDLHRLLAAPSPRAGFFALLDGVGSVLLHAGWLQLVGNLLYLRVFGDNVEDRFGRVFYLLFFLLSGLASLVGHALGTEAGAAPLVGVQGAVTAILGAYLVLCPASRVVTLFPIVIVLTFIEVPAVVFLGIWGAQQLLYGYLPLEPDLVAPISWYGHAAGLAFGLATGVVYRLYGALSARSK